MKHHRPADKDDYDTSDLRPKTFWEKHGFKVLLAAFALAVFIVGLIFG
jgi:hypothetical protein